MQVVSDFRMAHHRHPHAKIQLLYPVPLWPHGCCQLTLCLGVAPLIKGLTMVSLTPIPQGGLVLRKRAGWLTDCVIW